MATKYCIKSGSFDDASIWSLTSGGPGGAGVPGNSDDIMFDRSVTVTDFTSAADSRAVTVAEGATVDLSGGPWTMYGNNTATVHGTLNYQKTTAAWGLWGDSRLYVSERGRINMQGDSLRIRDRSRVVNDGYIGREDGTAAACIVSTAQGSPRQNLGRISVVEISTYGAIDCHIALEGRLITKTMSLYNGAGNNATYLDLGATNVDVETLMFSGPVDAVVKMIQNGRLSVSGSVYSYGAVNDVDWQSGSDAERLFVGTADQTVAFPAGLVGQKWTVDKPAGKLELSCFHGFLQGRLRQLTVRAASGIDLSGDSPLLDTSSQDSCWYRGIKADATLNDEQEGRLGLADHRREAMDSCVNYGSIVIGGSKTICTKSLANYAGGIISGTGTLCVRYGGLSNSGTIEAEIRQRCFDYPIAATLFSADAVNANEVFSVNITGSVGSLFRLDWGDGTFSEATTASVFAHTYVETVDTRRTLTLFVTNEDGTVETAVKAITVVAPVTPVDPPVFGGTGAIEIDARKKYYGFPRGNWPALYRYTLAQGICFMHDTLQLFCPMNESGRAVENGSALFLGRITYSDGQPILPSEIVSASYTVFRLDNTDPARRTPIEGHTDVPLAIGDVLLPEPILDENWAFDAVGYNFRHFLDDSTYSPFPKAGRNYLVAYTLRTEANTPKIMPQYRVRVI